MEWLMTLLLVSAPMAAEKPVALAEVSKGAPETAQEPDEGDIIILDEDEEVEDEE